ncbi:TrkH family potassium uptake protein [Mediannikoviicoccus vaginalis]|uniref:TrkH family potassium uptake protein n=1 Tax=Mediannikoviicoccus vaginalis TaxID=2899727 RepID=UPI001F260BB8|nr:potassium transporter TrkG [Mediannikoviicoccus vaginalis]
MHFSKKLDKFTKLIKKIENNPPLYLMIGFLIIILIGSILLSLPISSANGKSTLYLDSLFVSTSAVCVTGLSPVVTATHWNFFGQLIIIILIQIGGLGVMTLSTLVAMLLGKRITLSTRLIIREQVGAKGYSGLVKLIRYVLTSTLVIESVGAFILAFSFVPVYGFFKGIWFSIFHSISSFCNAGFDLIGEESLLGVNTNFMIIFPIALLVIIGGIGFNVYMDITKYRLNFKRYSLHSKVVLTTTAILLASFTIIFFVFEFNNELTIGRLPVRYKLLNSFFQSVTLRTAGFSAMSQTGLHNSSTIMSMVAMIIGAAPASTGGGVKITTVALIIMVLVSEIRGDDDIIMYNKTIKFTQVKKAIAAFIIYMLWILVVGNIIVFMEPFKTSDVLYEVISALGTVGISRGITAILSPLSKILIIITMFFGRVGILTIIFATKKRKQKLYKEAYGTIILG